MKFSLKKDNYCNFNVFKENAIKPRSYFIPFNNEVEMLKSDIKTERYSSSMVEVLNGEWDFKYYKSVDDMPEVIDTATEKFDTVNVPSTWQHTGYEQPYYVNHRYQFKPKPPVIPKDCPVGVYHKIVNLENLDGNFVISFLGVAGAMDLFVNGKYVGYSETAHNTVEFELNKYLVVGDNEIVVVVHKWSNGSYLECQDMFRCNGIFRDVLLTKTTNNSIYDFEIKTTFSSDLTYNLSLIPTLKMTEDCELTATLMGDNSIIASKSINVTPTQVSAIDFSSLKVKEWSAEEPNLYQLIITLSKEGKLVEVVKRPVGFRHIKIKGNIFLFNSKSIKLLGVNHHDTNPKTGYAMTMEDMIKDVETFKEYNVNAVRTSHYPPDPSFIDLCDEYGVYVVDEADIETHGCAIELKRPCLISNNLKWKEHYWDRVKCMYERDKNHPSITMWSLGNEAEGYKNQDYCYNNLKQITDVPIHYEGVCRTRRWAYDVVSQMYPPIERTEKIAKGSGLRRKYYTKPYFMCEYAHAMGLGAGDLEKYVQNIYAGDNMLGGCIWEFVDHAAYHEDGEYKYTYGGDHGEFKHDYNFCVDGLFYPDRTPHAGAYQMKNCYRPVRATKLSDKEYSFHNYKYFTDATYTVKWQVLTDGVECENGEIKLNIIPRKNQKQSIDFKLQGAHQVVIFTYFDGDKEIATEQKVISKKVAKVDAPKFDAPTVQVSQERLFINYNNGGIIFNTTTGFLESYKAFNKQLINPMPLANFKGFGVDLYRAPIDNDMYIRKSWDKIKLSTEQFSKIGKVKYDTLTDRVIIKASYKIDTLIKQNLCKMDYTYTIYGNGAIKVELNPTACKKVKDLPRFGSMFEMPKEYNNVKYFGLGKLQNTNDFKEHCISGVYDVLVSQMQEKYIKPQEASMRTDVRYAYITNDEGKGIKIEAIDRPFTLSADHFTPQQCEKALHTEALKDCETTCVHIDAYMLGAGSNACGPCPSSNNRYDTCLNMPLSFMITPVGE